MADGTHIQWTDATWNPVTGCTKVSEGCDHCYIERTPPFRMAHRRFDKPGIGGATGVKRHPDRLSQPLRWRKPRRVFVNSLSDLFHDDIPDEFVAEVFGVMALAPKHTFQVLTKRPARMRSLLREKRLQTLVHNRISKRNIYVNPGPLPLPNVWLGVSVESQQWADIRIPQLLATPAAVRWLSCEPLLGPVDLGRYLYAYPSTAMGQGAGGQTFTFGPGLDWVVCGGESGPGARPMHPDWARSLRDQCQAARVPFFFKQWGEWAPNGARGIGAIEADSKGRERLIGEPIDDMGRRLIVEKFGKTIAGRELDGRTWDEYPAADDQTEDS